MNAALRLNRSTPGPPALPFDDGATPADPPPPSPAQLAQLAQGQARFCCLPLRCELTELACGSRWATAGEHTVCHTCPDGQRRRTEAGGGRIEQPTVRPGARLSRPTPRQAEPGQPTAVQRARAEMALEAIRAMPGGCASPSMLAPMMPHGLRRSSTISKALALLADEGVIERMSRGVYRVPGGAPGLPPVGDSDEERRRAAVMAMARATPSGVDAQAAAAHIGTTALDAHHPRQQLLNLARVALRVLCSRGWLTRARIEGRRGWVYMAADFGGGCP